MTREQAADIIAVAFGSQDSDYDHAEVVLAQRIALALDALGILDYAISPEQRAAAQMSAAPLNPATQMSLQHSRTNPPEHAPDQSLNTPPPWANTPHWAKQRQRP